MLDDRGLIKPEDDDGASALGHARYHGRVDVERLMLARDADTVAAPDEGVMHVARHDGHDGQSLRAKAIQRETEIPIAPVARVGAEVAAVGRVAQRAESCRSTMG